MDQDADPSLCFIVVDVSQHGFEESVKNLADDLHVELVSIDQVIHIVIPFKHFTVRNVPAFQSLINIHNLRIGVFDAAIVCGVELFLIHPTLHVAADGVIIQFLFEVSELLEAWEVEEVTLIFAKLLGGEGEVVNGLFEDVKLSVVLVEVQKHQGEHYLVGVEGRFEGDCRSYVGLERVPSFRGEFEVKAEVYHD